MENSKVKLLMAAGYYIGDQLDFCPEPGKYFSKTS
jgi:hypothetical protein